METTTIKRTRPTRRISNRQKTLRAIDDCRNNRNLVSVDCSSFEAFMASVLDDKNSIAIKSAEEITTSVSELLDAEFGTIGTPEREKHLDEALAWMREELGDEEFYKWAEKNQVYA